MPEVAGPAGIIIDKTKPTDAIDFLMATLADKERYQLLRRSARAFARQYSEEAIEDNLAAQF